MITEQPNAASRVYAQSLFELATAKGGKALVETCADELEAIVELARGDAKFAQFLSTPAITAVARVASLRKMFHGRVSPQTCNFLLVLADKGRLGAIGAVAASYDELVQAHFGVVEADVFTAAPLPPEELKAVSDKLANVLGKQVVAHNYIEQAMIGGVKIRIGDQLLDGSIATQLRRMKDQLSREGLSKVRNRAGAIVE